MPIEIACAIIVLLVAVCVGMGWQLAKSNNSAPEKEPDPTGPSQDFDTQTLITESSGPTDGDEFFYRHRLLDSLVDGVILLDSESKISFLNRSMKETLQVGESYLGLTLMEAFRSQELMDLIEKIRE